MKNARRVALPGLLALVAALALGGCSSDAAAEDEASTPAADDAAPDAAAQGGAGVPGTDRGGVSGLVAAVSDAVAQVQDAESQTAVTWDDATVFRRTTTVTLDAVTVGSCVVAVLPGEDSGDTAATSVAVSEAVDGECSAGVDGPWSGGPGEGPDGAGAPGAEDGSGGLSSLDDSGGAGDGAATPPEGERPEMPEGEAPTGPAGGFGSIVAGRVTGVSGTTLTIEVLDADGASTSQTVATSGETAVTTTAVADSSALVVGVCADVQGEADTSGGMAATSITISDPGDDGCTVRGGFGGMPGGQRPGEESADE